MRGGATHGVGQGGAGQGEQKGEVCTRGQTLPYVVDDVGVGVELGHVMPDVLLAGVAERLLIGSVGPEDGPVAGDLMSPDHPIVEVIGHIPFRTDERACRLHGASACLAPANDRLPDKTALRKFARDVATAPLPLSRDAFQRSSRP
jgi:hypothetical protein